MARPHPFPLPLERGKRWPRNDHPRRARSDAPHPRLTDGTARGDSGSAMGHRPTTT